MRTLVAFILCMALCASPARAGGNARLESREEAERLLFAQVYPDHRVTLYCGAAFDASGAVALPPGFTPADYAERAGRVEVEEIIPAGIFGRSFVEWRRGAPQCADAAGRRFKGRACAEALRQEFRLMQADLYNLAPVIGAVKAKRKNYTFAMLPGIHPAFGSCAVKIAGRFLEPPDAAKGFVARTAFYMAQAYGPYFHLTPQQRLVFQGWDSAHPVTAWECLRARRIEAVQGNRNEFVAVPCAAAGL